MMHLRLFTITAVAAASSILAAPAAAQPRELEARVDALAAEVEELREHAVQAPPIAAAVEDLASAVAALEEEVGTLRRQQQAIPDAIATIGDLEARVRDLERELGLLRAQLADLEQPVMGAGGGVGHDGGFSFQSGDGEYALNLWGRLQPRYQLEVSQGFDEVERSAIRLRRARLGLEGHVRDSLRYALQFELQSSTPLVDAILDYVIRDELTLRAGQYKVPHTRSYLTSGGNLGFAERPRAVDALRHDRDIAVSAHGRIADGRLSYHAGAGNGGGRNVVNDDLDMAPFVRLDATLLGEAFGHRIADLDAERATSVMVGASVVHDARRLPDVVGGVSVGNADVDGDGERDVVRVVSASADMAFAHHGLDITLEGLWRREDWGVILDHPDNAAVAGFVGGGVEGYLGAYGHVTYAVVPGRALIGGRVGHVDQPLFGVGGRDPARPREAGAPPNVGGLWEASAMGRLYRDGTPFLGFDYTYFDHDIAGGGPGHRFIVEAQVEL